jgi:hypothetical protein
MQVLVVALILPSLLLLSTTIAYPLLRISGVLFAGAASLGWMAERLFEIKILVDVIVNAFAQRALVSAAGLFLVSLAVRVLLTPSTRRPISTEVGSKLDTTKPLFENSGAPRF